MVLLLVVEYFLFLFIPVLRAVRDLLFSVSVQCQLKIWGFGFSFDLCGPLTFVPFDLCDPGESSTVSVILKRLTSHSGREIEMSMTALRSHHESQTEPLPLIL